MVRLLIGKGVGNETARSLLNGHNVTKLLGCKSAGKKEATGDGRTPFFIACEKGHLEIVQLLVMGLVS